MKLMFMAGEKALQVGIVTWHETNLNQIIPAPQNSESIVDLMLNESHSVRQ